MSDAVADLLRFIDRSPTPYHAVRSVRERLEAVGFAPLDEAAEWPLELGGGYFVERGGGSIAAIEIGTAPPAEAGFRVIGAHTDSPNLRLKPLPDVVGQGYRQLGVEPYGGVLLHTWLDRDLSLAGRVTLRDRSGGTRTVLVDFERPLLRVPSLAIHLFRELREQGLKLNEQTHMAPVLGLESEADELRPLLVEELARRGAGDVRPEAILAWELMTYDTQPSTVSGAAGEFMHAPRLDNLASSHAALCALERAAGAGASAVTRVVVLYDHEEVGSRSRQGAGGSFLADLLERLADRLSGGAMEAHARAISRSFLVSADMAHAVHPNYADRHEPGHRPRIGDGPVIKTNHGQSYATDAETAGYFAALCAEVGVRPQQFVTRSDLGCGSTIGPVSAARVGIRAVDVGNPMLSMHSCREMAGTADVEPMIEVMTRFFRDDPA